MCKSYNNNYLNNQIKKLISWNKCCNFAFERKNKKTIWRGLMHSIINDKKVDIATKLIYTDYIVYKLIEWLEQLGYSKEVALKRIDKLTTMKMIFFIVAASTSPKRNYYGLLNIFDNFVAMPYGPVELDVYEHFNELKHYNIFRETKIKQEFDINSIDPKIKKDIDTPISILSNINKNLINNDGFDLVEITHKWGCWRDVYNNRRSNTDPISRESILNDWKYFS